MGTGRIFIALIFFISCIGNHHLSVKFFIPADSSRCALDSCACFENQFTVLCDKYETKIHCFVSTKDLEFTTRLASLLSLNGLRKGTSAYTMAEVATICVNVSLVCALHPCIFWLSLSYSSAD